MPSYAMPRSFVFARLLLSVIRAFCLTTEASENWRVNYLQEGSTDWSPVDGAPPELLLDKDKPQDGYNSDRLIWIRLQQTGNTTFRPQNCTQPRLTECLFKYMRLWIIVPNTLIRTPNDAEIRLLNSSNSLDCSVTYDCLFGRTTETVFLHGKEGWGMTWADDFTLCYSTRQGPSNVSCPLRLNRVEGWERFEQICSDSGFATTRADWNESRADHALFTFMHGGRDEKGFWWPGVKKENPNATLPHEMGQHLLNGEEFYCNLEHSCDDHLDCASAGTRENMSLGTSNATLPIKWAFLAVIALENINKQLQVQYKGLQDAAIDATIATFNIDRFFPNKKNFSIQNLLLGLGMAASIIAGIPSVLSGPLGILVRSWGEPPDFSGTVSPQR